MLQGTYFVREHEARLLDVLTDIIGHGFGEVTIQVSETKNFKTKILIVAGRSWAYFISKDVPKLNEKDIL
jgi:hypothetical protein